MSIREVLFRGKRKDNGEWIEGGYCYCDNKSYIVINTRYIPDTRDWDEADYYEENPVYKPVFIEVISETVGQYTGLTDKNDTKIFEGNIVRGTDAIHRGREVYGYIDHKNGSFVIVGDLMTHYRWLDYNVEIIGNIHDNPELI